MYLTIIFLVVALCGIFNAEVKSSPQAASFLVTEKQGEEKSTPHSKTALKETIGDKLEDVMRLSARMHNALGALQISLSKIQAQLVDVSTNLINNRPPLKKASKKNLQESLKVLEHAEAVLKEQVEKVGKVQEQLNGATCLKNG